MSEQKHQKLAIRKMLSEGSSEEQTSPKRLLTGHSTIETELGYYNFQDVDDLKRIYDLVGIRIFD